MLLVFPWSPFDFLHSVVWWFLHCKSCGVRLLLILDTGFVCVTQGYIGKIPCYWYSLGHLWASYIQWCSDFSNCKCCAQYAEPETPKRGYGQCLGYSKPTGSDDVIRSDLYFRVRIAVCNCSDWSPCSSFSIRTAVRIAIVNNIRVRRHQYIRQLWEYWIMMLRLYDLQSSETETMSFWFPCLPSLLCYCPMQVHNYTTPSATWDTEKEVIYQLILRGNKTSRWQTNSLTVNSLTRHLADKPTRWH